MSLARNYFQSCRQTVHQSAAWSVCDRGQEWSHTMDIPWKSLCHKGHLHISAKLITTLGSLQYEKLWILQLAVREWGISLVCMYQMINRTWTACRDFICGVILLSYSNTVGHTLHVMISMLLCSEEKTLTLLLMTLAFADDGCCRYAHRACPQRKAAKYPSRSWHWRLHEGEPLKSRRFWSGQDCQEIQLVIVIPSKLLVNGSWMACRLVNDCQSIAIF